MSVKKKDLKYLNKDFDGFRIDLLNYAKSHFGDKIKDFSEPSVAGMFLDLAAYVGDVMSFYLDWQFGEIFLDSAKEKKSIQKIMNQFGYRAAAPTPANVQCTFQVEVPSYAADKTRPDSDYLPTIKRGTTCISDSGVSFELLEDIDFSVYSDENISVGNIDSSGNVSTYLLELPGYCVSGDIKTYSSTLRAFKAFLKVELPDDDITEIISVYDAAGNEYYEVMNLSEDTVFRATKNLSSDAKLVPDSLDMIYAPYRFVSIYDIETKKTTVQFGAGQTDTEDADIIPDPSQYAVPMYGKTTMTSFSINPNKFIRSRTLGVCPYNTTLSVRYRVGGGLSHNVSAHAIKSIGNLSVGFVGSSTASSVIRANVSATIAVDNRASATGGDARQTLDEIKNNVGGYYASQNRIVTKEDYLARIYSMPSRFGRVFRARVVPSQVPHTVDLRVLSRDSAGKLIQCPDMLKLNLRKYLSSITAITDRVEIFDSKIVNLAFDFNILTQSGYNKEDVLNKALSDLYKYFNIMNFQIGQSILISDVKNLIYNVDGVISVYNLEFFNRVGSYDGQLYSGEVYDINIDKDILVCPHDSIFEIKHLDFDIRGKTA